MSSAPVFFLSEFCITIREKNMRKSIKDKLISRIIKNCELYSNDFEYLNSMTLAEVYNLYFALLVPVLIKQRYRLRRKNNLRPF